jgi:hypothetical protein
MATPPSPPPLPFIVQYAHPIRYQRTGRINADSLTHAQAIAEASVAGTLWTVVSVKPYTG